MRRSCVYLLSLLVMFSAMVAADQQKTDTFPGYTITWAKGTTGVSLFQGRTIDEVWVAAVKSMAQKIRNMKSRITVMDKASGMISIEEIPDTWKASTQKNPTLQTCQLVVEAVEGGTQITWNVANGFGFAKAWVKEACKTVSANLPAAK